MKRSEEAGRLKAASARKAARSEPGEIGAKAFCLGRNGKNNLLLLLEARLNLPFTGLFSKIGRRKRLRYTKERKAIMH